jgi:hypothetical protein
LPLESWSSDGARRLHPLPGRRRHLRRGRFVSWFGPTFWDTPGKAVESHIGGHCAVFPNDELLGRFTCRYQGDYDYIRSTLDNWGGDDQAVWVDDVIAIARPQIAARDKVLA